MQTNRCSTMVRFECANIKQGRCLFAGECPVLSGRRCTVSHKVLAGESPTADDSDYFSVCVLPLAKSHPEYAEAAAEYARICGTTAALKNRPCDCGEPLAHRERCCRTCRRKRATATQRKWRSQCRELTRFGAM
jgi:hypothetical protein